MAMSLQGISEFDPSTGWQPSPSPKSSDNPGLTAVTWEESELDMIFEAKVRNLSDRVVVVLDGELDMSTVSIFEEALTEAERCSGTVVLDLSRLSFMDCSGLHSFIRAHRRISAHGGRVFFIKGVHHIQRLFELTQLSSIFEFVEAELPA